MILAPIVVGTPRRKAPGSLDRTQVLVSHIPVMLKMMMKELTTTVSFMGWVVNHYVTDDRVETADGSIAGLPGLLLPPPPEPIPARAERSASMTTVTPVVPATLVSFTSIPTKTVTTSASLSPGFHVGSAVLTSQITPMSQNKPAATGTVVSSSNNLRNLTTNEPPAARGEDQTMALVPLNDQQLPITGSQARTFRNTSNARAQVRSPTPYSHERDVSPVDAPSPKRAREISPASGGKHRASPKRRRLLQPAVEATPRRQQPTRQLRSPTKELQSTTNIHEAAPSASTRTVRAAGQHPATYMGPTDPLLAVHEALIYLHIPGEPAKGRNYPIPERLSTGIPTLEAFKAAVKLMKKGKHLNELKVAQHDILRSIHANWPPSVQVADKVKAIFDLLQ
jgi:hypothetical protein